jgi:hypothetical protein
LRRVGAFRVGAFRVGAFRVEAFRVEAFRVGAFRGEALRLGAFELRAAVFDFAVLAFARGPALFLVDGPARLVVRALAFELAAAFRVAAFRAVLRRTGLLDFARPRAALVAGALARRLEPGRLAGRLRRVELLADFLAAMTLPLCAVDPSP